MDHRDCFCTSIADDMEALEEIEEMERDRDIEITSWRYADGCYWVKWHYTEVPT